MTLIPISARAWMNDEVGRISRPMGMEGVPLNYKIDGGAWDHIVLDWIQVNATRWKVERGRHRAWVETDGGLLLDFPDRSGGRHRLGIRPRWLVKFKTSDRSYEAIASESASTPIFSGAAVTFPDVFPGIDREVSYFNHSVSDRFIFHQSARDALASAGPWAGHWLGIVSDLDISALNLNWRDGIGDFIIDTGGRLSGTWFDCHKDGERVFALAESRLRHSADSGVEDRPIVRKFVVKKGGNLYLIELFDPIEANQLPPGDLYHYATFGYGTIGGSTSNFKDTALSYLGSPAADGTADSITVYTGGVGIFGVNPTYLKCALYDHASPPLGSSARETTKWNCYGQIYGWRTVTFLSSFSIYSANQYNIAAWGEDNGAGSQPVAKAETSGGTNRWKIATWADPDSWPDLDNSNALKLSIYCTYTEGVAVSRQLALTGVGT